MSVRANLRIVVMALMFSLVMVSVTLAGTTLYVDDDASPGGDGSSWDTAFKYLQDGLAAASYGDEIRVAQGSYIPDQNSANPGGTGIREATFQLINGVALKGGYAGAGEPGPNERDVEAYETILSGDLLGNDGPDFANNGENSYHVTTGSDTDPNTVFDGFTITAGNANGSWPNSSGGGMFNNTGNPTVTNCTFTINYGLFGGGMRNRNSVSAITNCTFIGNSTDDNGGGIRYSSCGGSTLTNCTFIDNSSTGTGGGLSSSSGNLTITNCIFIGNSAGVGGGGVSTADNDSTITNCVFIGNSAGGSGGGISIGASYPTLVNCTFSGNSASFNGGGMNCTSFPPTLINCTFSGNSAGSEGGGIWFGHLKGIASLTNCILWDNNAGEGPQISLFNTTLDVSYSCVQGGEMDVYISSFLSTLNWDEETNIGEDLVNDDPLFADADNDDCHLRSPAGRWDPDASSWVIDVVTSPCIDAGDPVSDWSAELWPHGKRINMGAFGGTPQASMSTSSAGNIADLDTDGSVDGIDLTILADKWLYQQVLLSEDLDRDGSVKFKDFAIFAGEWFWEE